MSPALEIPVIVAAGILSGFINTLASSGSAITLPLMILIGLPANVANGTNRLPILARAVAAIATFHRAGVIEWRNGLLLSMRAPRHRSSRRRRGSPLRGGDLRLGLPQRETRDCDPDESYFRDARMLTFPDGTSEIHPLLIGRHAIGLEAFR